VLLVDDDEAQVGIADPLGEEGVRPDDDRRPPVGDRVEGVGGARAGERARQQRHGEAERLQEVAQGRRVLAGQEVGRGQERSLHAGLGHEARA